MDGAPAGRLYCRGIKAEEGPSRDAAPTEERDGCRKGDDNVSIKIRVSYTEDEELTGVMRLLSPLGVRWKRQPKKGRYMRAYSVLKHGRSPSEAERGEESE